MSEGIQVSDIRVTTKIIDTDLAKDKDLMARLYLRKTFAISPELRPDYSLADNSRSD